MSKLRTQTGLLLVASLILLLAGPAGAATAPTLLTLESFAVLAGTTVTNTGPTVIGGDLGVSPGSAVTGFPPGIVTPPGTIYAGDAVALQAQNDLTTSYNHLAGQSCDENLTDQDLGGKTLTPGTYCFDTSAQLTGPLTLNTQGNPDSVFIFKIGSTLTTASNSSVGFINGASCHVYWQVGSSATLGTTTDFTGNVLALTSVTANTGATVEGRLLARNGAVTLDSNTVNRPACSTPVEDEDDTPEPTPAPTVSPTPAPVVTTPPTSDTTTGGPDDTEILTGTFGSPGDSGSMRRTLVQQSSGSLVGTPTSLPRTGVDVLPMALSGIASLLLGMGLLFESRRRSLKKVQ